MPTLGGLGGAPEWIVIMGLPPFWQPVAIGAVLMLAVYIGTIRRRDQLAR